MKVASTMVLILFLGLSSGCASQQRRAEATISPQCRTLATESQAPGAPLESLREALFCPTDEVRAARLRLAAAVIVVAGEIVLEIIKANN